MKQDMSLSRILKLTAPAIFMMLFLSTYTIVDGAFVSKFINTDALSGLNIVYPYVNFLLGVSIMLSAGGCALVMKKMGEGKSTEAKKDFTLIIVFATVLSIFISIISLIFLDSLLKLFKAEGALYVYAKEYLFYIILFATPTILKSIVEQFLISINKPHISLLLTILGGSLNIFLDYVFIVVFKWGIKGAAIATGLGYAVPAFIGILFFIKKSNFLHFLPPTKDIKVILKSCYNGSSEMISQLSNGIITFLFNMVMLKHLGVDGVASITIVLYIQFLITSVFLGYCIGIAPRISFYYGDNNPEVLKKIINISFKFTAVISVIIYIIILILSPTLIRFFTQEGTKVYDITMKGIKLYSLSFLFVGFNIFTSGMFTAFSNGKVSATISFLKTLVFESLCIILFSIMFGVIGIWLAVPTAQVLGILVCFYYYKKYKNVYGY